MKLQDISFKNFILKVNFYSLTFVFQMIKMTDTLEKSVPQMIMEHLKENGTKQVWLAERVGISPEHISNILADRVLLTEEILEKINTVLGTDFKK